MKAKVTIIGYTRKDHRNFINVWDGKVKWPVNDSVPYQNVFITRDYKSQPACRHAVDEFLNKMELEEHND